MNFIKVIYSFSVVATLLSTITLASPITKHKNVSLELNQKKREIEVNQVFDPTMLINGGNYQEVLLPLVNTSEAGQHVLTYQAKLDFNQIEKQVVLEVVDKTAPKFTKTIDKITLDYKATPINLANKFKAKDNYDEDITIKQLQSINTAKEGQQTITIEASDSSGNIAQHQVVVTIKPKPKPKPKPVVKVVENRVKQAPTSNTERTTSHDKSAVDVRLTLYGANCIGCRQDKNGNNQTASGIYIGLNSVRQNDGTWRKGITYEGYYIVATGKNWPLCTVGQITNHSLSGQGIQPGKPIQVVVGDRGVSGNHLDLFAGNEAGFNGVHFIRNYRRGTFIVTGIATRTRTGCRF